MLKTGLLFALGLPLIQFFAGAGNCPQAGASGLPPAAGKTQGLGMGPWGPAVFAARPGAAAGPLVGAGSASGCGFGAPGRLSRRAGG